MNTFIVLYELILMFIIRDMKKLKKRCKIVRSHFNDMTPEQKMIRMDGINKW